MVLDLNVNCYLTLYRINNSRWNTDLEGENKISKLLEENTGKCIIETKAATYYNLRNLFFVCVKITINIHTHMYIHMYI